MSMRHSEKEMREVFGNFIQACGVSPGDWEIFWRTSGWRIETKNGGSCPLGERIRSTGEMCVAMYFAMSAIGVVKDVAKDPPGVNPKKGDRFIVEEGGVFNTIHITKVGKTSPKPAFGPGKFIQFTREDGSWGEVPMSDWNEYVRAGFIRPEKPS